MFIQLTLTTGITFYINSIHIIEFHTVKEHTQIIINQQINGNSNFINVRESCDEIFKMISQ